MLFRKYLYLRLKGEMWVAYPSGMRFPIIFSTTYPFRGRGLVSRVLYFLNASGLDKFFLTSEENPIAALGDNMAYCWPSPKRATDRFYGYKVIDRKVVEYCKIATSSIAKDALRKEAANVQRAVSISPRSFHVPKFLGFSESNDMLIAHFEPLPQNAASSPNDENWISRINDAAGEIAQTGYAHGDFCLHNIKVCGNRLWIVDWEEMLENPPRFLDEISFFVSLECCRGKISIDDIVDAVKKRFSDRCDIYKVLRSMSDRKILLGDQLLAAFLGDNDYMRTSI